MLFIHEGDKQKNSDRFDYIYDKFYAYAYKIAFNVVQNSEDMKDVMQNIFIKVWRNIDKMTDDISSKALIATISYNTAVDFCRVRGRYYGKIDDKEDEVIVSTMSDKNGNPEDLILNNDSVERVYDEIGKMKKRYAHVLLLSFKYDMSPEQIAVNLNRNTKTVYTQLERGCKMLIDRLMEKEGRICNE